MTLFHIYNLIFRPTPLPFKVQFLKHLILIKVEIERQGCKVGSKVFEGNIQYSDIYHKESIQAKKDIRLKKSGEIIGFYFQDKFWKNEPKIAFYDWLYINALIKRDDIIAELLNYSAFSDIEFNPKKSINCQARTCAIFVSLVRLDLIEEALSSNERFIEVVYPKKLRQNSLF